MAKTRHLVRPALTAAALLWNFAPAAAQTPGTAPASDGPPQYRSVEHTARAESPAVPAGHPLQKAIEMGNESLIRARQIRDYAYTFVKREEVAGKLNDHEAIFMKVRNEPFSVYVYTLGPKQEKGQEAIYVAGRNQDKVLVHVTGFRHKLVGTMSMAPDAPEIMEGSRYPMNSAGTINMLNKVIASYHRELADAVDSDVQVIPGAKVDGRSCTCVQVSHRAPRPSFRFQTTRIFYDEETGLPIRWEAYGFPSQPGQPPVLQEEYTYRNMQLNVGLTDADFDTNNPQYGFR